MIRAVDLFCGAGGTSEGLAQAAAHPERIPPGHHCHRHGLSRTPEYRAWQTMRLRCTNPSNPAWKDYGGRGITVCDRWLNSVEAFVADMGLKPSPKHELDRIDNGKGYSPDNCRWVTRRRNCRNRRSTRWVTYRGRRLSIPDAAEIAGVSAGVFRRRIDSGWSVERAVETRKRPTAESRALDVLRVLRVRGVATTEELVEATALSDGQVRAGLRVLRESGRAERTGERKQIGIGPASWLWRCA